MAINEEIAARLPGESARMVLLYTHLVYEFGTHLRADDVLSIWTSEGRIAKGDRAAVSRCLYIAAHLKATAERYAFVCKTPTEEQLKVRSLVLPRIEG